MLWFGHEDIRLARLNVWESCTDEFRTDAEIRKLAKSHRPHNLRGPVMRAQVEAVDTNGAGDTFATAYMLALARRARSPGATANWVASRAVMQPQACKPQCVLDGIVLGSSYARYRQWVRLQVRPPTPLC